MTTPQQKPGPNLVLNKSEFVAYAARQGWTSVRQQAKALGLDNSAVGSVTQHDGAVGIKFFTRLVAHAIRAGHTYGEACERFFTVEAANADEADEELALSA